MDKTQRTKIQKAQRRANVLEALKDIGDSTGNSLKKDLLAGTSEEFLNEILGRVRPQKFSGDIEPGQVLEMSDIFSGKSEEVQKVKRQSAVEKTLLVEEKALVEKRSGELKLQIHALSQEVMKLAGKTQNLSEEIQIAAMTVPVEVGEYHLVFFEKLLGFIKSFRAKIGQAVTWLHASNKRAEKKNYWSMYKKKGSSFLLAPDHYLQRSAG